MSFDNATPRIPKRRLECDVHSLPLTPEEAFLLSRIDDHVNEAELALLTGLDITLVQSALERLLELGAIQLEAVTRRPPAGEISAVVAEAFAGLRQTAFDISGLSIDIEVEVEPQAPSELDELCDLNIEEKRRILDLYHRLDELDHYSLLQVPLGADKRTIKRAYYELAPNFHPDRYFRKDLGSFKPKMEAIFGRLTLAHDTLTRNDERAAYDAELARTSRARSSKSDTWSAITAPPPPPRASGSFASPTAAPASPLFSSPSSPPPASSPGMSMEEERLRRAALARKLLGHGAASQPSSPPSSSGDSGTWAAEAAVETLRQRRMAVQDGTTRMAVARYVQAAEAAQARGDLAAAANSFRLAREIAPDDLEIAALQEQMARAASTALAQGYLEQGDAEAKQQRWQDAALSYAKAANGLPRVAAAQLKAATAILRSQSDVRKAVDYARRAVSLEPKLFEARHALAEAYLVAGLQALAKKELDAMREIAPKDARLATLARRIR